MKKGFTLIEIIVIVGIISLLASITIPNLLRSKIAGNETAACATLKTISTAAELFAISNSGVYPTSETLLTSGAQPYLRQSFCGLTLQGYVYSCNWRANFYTIAASPEAPGRTGNRIFTIYSGGVLTGL